ncbi:DUF2911 domain-containing protein [Arenibacter sp. M-2]|uniref:DUF2911 domain-containing protein n=1 Tax=Arenibacter sp. M-2 TaxID=3053612 RepID=UPI002571126B|nr:DUF2911 domain-containing protein [Arenibacter sp. M-2]MDL5511130.1 DUF2911 domain-containing protein [Arenibacter sp. M-2]
MNKVFQKLILTCAILSSSTAVKAQVDFPNPSPMQRVIQNFGMSKIELQYSRPGAKGRKMIGYVEPFDSVWRTGANAPTKITFFDPVEIMGRKIDSGTYAIYTIPRKKVWTVIINKGIQNWGSDDYKESDDVCRFETTKEKSSQFRETLSFEFNNVKQESCSLVLSWEDWSITIPIKANYKDRLRNQIEANITSSNPNYWEAAQFYYEYDSNLQAALEMINKAIEGWEKVNGKPYWQHYYKAKILKDLGRKTEAMEAAKLSAKQAREHGNRNNYQKLNEDLIKSL